MTGPRKPTIKPADAARNSPQSQQEARQMAESNFYGALPTSVRDGALRRQK